MAGVIAGLTIALLPLFTKVADVDVSRLSKDNLLLILFGVIALALKNNRRLPITVLIALAYGLFMLIWNQWHPASIMVQYQSLYIGLGIIFFAQFYKGHTNKDKEHVLNGMAIGCLIQSIMVILAWYKLPIYYNALEAISGGEYVKLADYHGNGSLGNPNLLAAYVSLTAIALLRKRMWILLWLPVIALIIANSMMGFLTMLAGVFYFLNAKAKVFPKFTLYPLAALSMFVAYFTGVNGMDTHRFLIWSKVLDNVDFMHFLFGKGPGWFFDHAIIHGKQIAIQEHNEFLSFFNVFGIIGIALAFTVFIPVMFKKDKSSIFPAVCFAGFFNAFGHFSFHQSTTAIILIIAMAIVLAEGKECHQHGTAAP